MLKDRRIGFFEIPLSHINRYPDTVKQVLAGLIVVDADLVAYSGCIEYMAIGDAFEPCPEGQTPPWYKPILYQEADRTVTFRGWERIQK